MPPLSLALFLSTLYKISIFFSQPLGRKQLKQKLISKMEMCKKMDTFVYLATAAAAEFFLWFMRQSASWCEPERKQIK